MLTLWKAKAGVTVDLVKAPYLVVVLGAVAVGSDFGANPRTQAPTVGFQGDPTNAYILELEGLANALSFALVCQRSNSAVSCIWMQSYIRLPYGENHLCIIIKNGLFNLVKKVQLLTLLRVG